MALLYRHACFTGQYTTSKIHKNYIQDPIGLFSIISRVFYQWRNFGNFPLLFYRCHFVYIIKRTLHGGLKIWILFSRGKNNILPILFCHSKIKFISSRHRVISSMYCGYRPMVRKLRCRSMTVTASLHNYRKSSSAISNTWIYFRPKPVEKVDGAINRIDL